MCGICMFPISLTRYSSVRTRKIKKKKKKKSDILFTYVVFLFCAIEPLFFLPPSLPSTRGKLVGPILQYLYFSMLKPQYTINYINKL